MYLGWQTTLAVELEVLGCAELCVLCSEAEKSCFGGSQPECSIENEVSSKLCVLSWGI